MAVLCFFNQGIFDAAGFKWIKFLILFDIKMNQFRQKTK